MAVVESEKNDLLAFYNVDDRDTLPENVLESSINTIVISSKVLMASQTDYHILRGQYTLIQQMQTFFILEDAVENLNESTFPVKVIFPRMTYTIVIKGHDFVKTMTDGLKVFKGQFELVVKDSIMYLSAS